MNRSCNRWVGILSLVLVIAFVMGIIPANELRADMNTHGEYNCSPLFVSYEKLSSWLNSTQGEFVVTNNSDTSVDEWKLEIEYLAPVKIDNIWNANLITEGIVESNKIVVENLSYNGHIDPQGSISFGLIETGENEAPVAPISVKVFQEEDIEEQNPIEVIPTDNPEISTPSVGSFPYVIFASSTEDDLSISGWKSNIIGDIFSGREIDYSYDSLEKLIGEVALINEEEVTNISYTYDSNSNRTSKTTDGVTTYYLNDSSTGLSQVLLETTETNEVFYVRGLDLILREENTNTIRYYLTDGSSTITKLTDEDGNVTDDYLFDTFGELISHTGNSDNSYGFQGEQLDETTGLYYLRARYMDPATGTFTSIDT